MYSLLTACMQSNSFVLSPLKGFPLSAFNLFAFHKMRLNPETVRFPLALLSSSLFSFFLLSSFVFSLAHTAHAQIPQALYNDLVDSALYQKASSCLHYKHKQPDDTVEDLQAKCAVFGGACASPDFQIVKILRHENSKIFTNSGYIALDHAKKRVVLAFCGSKTWIDWMADMTFSLETFHPVVESSEYRKWCRNNECKTHMGFSRAHKSLFDSFHEDIKALTHKYSHYRVWVTGHSLGGAIAALAGVELRLQGVCPVVVGCGTPKVGNEAYGSFVDSLFHVEELKEHVLNAKEADQAYEEFKAQNGIYVRLRHIEDVVPQLPPSAVFYSHSGLEIYIAKKEIPHNPEDLQLYDASVYNDIDDTNSTETDLPDTDFYTDTADDYDTSKLFQGLKFSKPRISRIPKFKRKAHANYFHTVTKCK